VLELSDDVELIPYSAETGAGRLELISAIENMLAL
jgi:hypothetical protein